MKTCFGRLLPLLLLTPYICAYVPNPDGDEEYSIAIAAGRGVYADVSRDCNGNITSIENHKYEDVAVQFAGRYDVLKYGVTGGRTSALQPRNDWESAPATGPIVYGAPKVGLSTTIVGADIGLLFSLNGNLISTDRRAGRSAHPTFGIRVGKMSALHFSGGYLNNFPIVSGGGVYDAGLGGPVGSSNLSQIWFGVGAQPYDQAVLSSRGTSGCRIIFPSTPRFTVHWVTQGNSAELSA